MKTKNRCLSIFATAVIFSLGSAMQAQAEDISVSVSAANPFTDFAVYGIGGGYQVDVISANFPTDDSFVQLYTDAAPTSFNYNTDANPVNHVAEDDDGGGGYSSRVSGTANFGNYTIRVTSWDYWRGVGSETATYTLRYSGLYSGRYVSGNALRVDSVGTTTEKNNVVTCTPGKYTFLNGGSTAETAKVQSFVYTLLVNGKAVSTLSSDGFKTVAPHLFPTIAGNMAGTATLDGATWNLAGMSNYSAACQVYATQSGGNVQSVTTATSDSVALASQAEAAAKAQMAKDMIANWTASNEALIKKYRDQRLAGKP